jgi:phosphopantothenoylcysteine decarboxylase/phosphopantothenate--cysteine ligase
VKKGRSKDNLTKQPLRFITPLTLYHAFKKSGIDFVLLKMNKAIRSTTSNLAFGECMLIAPPPLKRWADVASGIADNLLVTTYLSARCPVFFARQWTWILAAARKRISKSCIFW